MSTVTAETDTIVVHSLDLQIPKVSVARQGDFIFPPFLQPRMSIWRFFCFINSDTLEDGEIVASDIRFEPKEHRAIFTFPSKLGVV